MSTILDGFTRGYIECALWSSTYTDPETGREDMPFDQNYSVRDLSSDALASIVADCKAFQETHAELLTQAYALYSVRPEWTVEEYAGHDFWLTRNGHGAGFWDRGLGDVGRQLTEASKAFGESNLSLNDDNEIEVI